MVTHTVILVMFAVFNAVIGLFVWKLANMQNKVNELQCNVNDHQAVVNKDLFKLIHNYHGGWKLDE